jgi:hypothetical protein
MERLLKVARARCQVTYKGKPIRITLGFSTETLKTRKAKVDVFQTLKKKIATASSKAMLHN